MEHFVDTVHSLLSGFMHVCMYVDVAELGSLSSNAGYEIFPIVYFPVK